MPAERQRSPIAGHGLFASDAYPAGAAVVTLDVARADLNHSCDPNLGVGADGLVARREIAVGEELTLDYAMVVSDPDFVLWCHCETYRCRQVVEGGDWAIPQLQQRYAGHWSPQVQQLIDGQ